MYATNRFNMENEIYFYQVTAKSVETAVHGKFEDTS